MARLRSVELLSLDVDGVLTDGGVYYTADGQVLRKFNVKDGVGIQQVLVAGVMVAIISAGHSGAIEHRGARLDIPHVFVDVKDKLATLGTLARELGIGLEAVAHVGDDLGDLAVLDAVGCPLSVADAIEAARGRAVHVTARRGGDGAVREICDLLMAARQGMAGMP